MLRYLVLFIFLLSCTQSFIEETLDMVNITAKVSYDTEDTGIVLEWESQWDFINVEILRGTSPTELKLYQDHVVQTSLIDTDAIAGQDYYYQINAYNSKRRHIGTSIVLKGRRSYRALDLVVAPSKLKASQREYSDKVELIWIGDPIDRFRIYRSTVSDKNYKLLTETGFAESDELKYIDLDVQPSTEYFYKVSAIGRDGNTIKEKYATDAVKGSTIDAPSKVEASQDMPGAVLISWAPESNVDFYRIYRSTTKDGTFHEIAPFVSSESYTDKNIPDYAGEYISGKYVYPSYFYKVRSVKQGIPSGMSSVAEGKAIDPADYLEAPKLQLTIDKSSYPYQVNLSWLPLAVEGVTYRLVKVNEANQTNVILESTSDTEITVPIEAFNTRWTYVLRPINNAVNGLVGGASEQIFRNTIPNPPTISTVSTNAREESIETVSTIPRDVYVYYYHKPLFKPGKEYEINVGKIEEEWLVNPIVGYIDLTWTKDVGASVDVYKVYRRKQGSTKWTLITNISTLARTTYKFRDTNFTSADYKGTGSMGSFAYPMYEYQLTAIFNNQESAPSAIQSGSAIDPEDIISAPSHVSIPGHWAKGLGFNPAKWRVGKNSPPDATLIHNFGGVNHLYLVWGEVAGATEYQVRHSVGDSKENFYENRSRFPHNKETGNIRYQWFNNETTGEDKTALYESDDFAGYVRNAASFDVAGVNGAKGGIVGQRRAILFREAASNPF